MILENGIRLNLKNLFGVSIDTYLFQENVAIKESLVRIGQKHSKSPSSDFRVLFEKTTSPELLDFLIDRMKAQLKEKGVRYDAIDAIFALDYEDDPVRLIARVDALSEFLSSEDGENLLIAFRRAANILRIEEKKDGCQYNGEIDPNYLEQNQERTLNVGLTEANIAIAKAIDEEDFVRAMRVLAKLREPIDAFFEKVTVNVDDHFQRVNRLKLLNGIRVALEEVADFSRIQG